jgi:carbon monoxide dehydrogenase subunit G
MAEFDGIETTQKINQPRKTVWAFFCAFHNRNQWIPGVSDAKLLTAGPLAVGSRYSQTRSFEGKTETLEFEITELEPEKTWVAMARPKGCVITYRYDFGGEGPQTIVTLKVHAEAVGFLNKLLLPLGLKTAKASDPAQLAGLKSAIGG